MDVTAHAMGETNDGSMLWVAIAITAFGPGVDGAGEVGHDVTLTLVTSNNLTGFRRLGPGSCEHLSR